MRFNCLPYIVLKRAIIWMRFGEIHSFICTLDLTLQMYLSIILKLSEALEQKHCANCEDAVNSENFLDRKLLVLYLYSGQWTANVVI